MARIMTGYRELLEDEVLAAWRANRFLLVSGLFVAIGIVAPILTRYLPDISRALGGPEVEIGIADTGPADVVDLLARILGQVGAVVAVLLTMGSIAGERERGTLAATLARPVAPAALVLAKAVAASMVLAVATVLAVLAAWLYSSLVFGGQALIPWLQLALFVWLWLVVIASITVLGSAVAPSMIGAAGIGVVGLAVLWLAADVPELNLRMPTGLIEVARAAALEESSPDLDPGFTVVISLAVIATALALAWLRMRREGRPGAAPAT
jgi:ABC-2 type transport system permease protein